MNIIQYIFQPIVEKAIVNELAIFRQQLQSDMFLLRKQILDDITQFQSVTKELEAQGTEEKGIK